jgi:hypothetical protein
MGHLQEGSFGRYLSLKVEEWVNPRHHDLAQQEVEEWVKLFCSEGLAT